MLSKARFLTFLWVFVACDLTLFHNATREGSPTELHNDLCKQSQDLNESRIIQARAIQSELLAIWPRAGISPAADLKATADVLLDVNKQMYEVCVSKESVRTSQTFALTEMKKLADPSVNSAWRVYIGVLEATIDGLKKGLL